MPLLSLRSIILFLSCAAIIAFSALLQSHSYLNADIGWHMEVARRLLQGQELYKDIVEVNLPLIYYLRILPVWLSQLTPLSEILWVNIFHYIVTITCFLLGWNILRNSSYAQNRTFSNIFIILSCFAFFILPLSIPFSHFGQKEHLFMVFTFPYMVSVIYSIPIEGRTQRIIIGILAGLGFCIKPFFVLYFILLEAWLVWHAKNPFAWKRPETLAIIATGLLYAVFILSVTPHYLTDMVPLIKSTYISYDNAGNTVLTLIASQLFIVFGAAVLLLWARICIKPSTSIPLLAVLCLLAIATVIVQRKGWGYHLYPALVLLVWIYARVTADFFTAMAQLAKGHHITAAVALDFLIVLFFCLALFNITVAGYNSSKNIEAEQRYGIALLTPIITAHKQDGPVVILSSNIAHAFPLINYTGASWASRFSALWIIKGIEQFRLLHQDKPETWIEEKIGRTGNYIRQAVTDDLHKYQPALVIVDKEKNYIDYLDKYGEFEKIWHNYQLVAEVATEQQGFLVYEKKGNYDPSL